MDAYGAIINANTIGSQDNALTERMFQGIDTTMKSMEGGQWTFQWRHGAETVRDQVKNIIKIIRMLKVIGICCGQCVPTALWPTARWSLCFVAHKFMQSTEV